MVWIMEFSHKVDERRTDGVSLNGSELEAFNFKLDTCDFRLDSVFMALYQITENFD